MKKSVAEKIFIKAQQEAVIHYGSTVFQKTGEKVIFTYNGHFAVVMPKEFNRIKISKETNIFSRFIENTDDYITVEAITEKQDMLIMSAKGFNVGINRKYCDFFMGCEFYIKSALSPIIAKYGDVIIGFIMPIRIN